MALQHFTKESFDQALNGGQLMMVDFWANWCMPCRMLGPVIQQLADQYDGRAVVGKVDVDAEGELAMRYGVMNIPTVIFFIYKMTRTTDRTRLSCFQCQSQYSRLFFQKLLILHFIFRPCMFIILLFTFSFFLCSFAVFL